jgi:hypothetical protein
MSKSLKERLLAEIQEGKVAMHPRVLYLIQLLSLAVTALAILAVTVFIVTIIFFTIRISSHETLLGFGTNGIATFLLLFPWSLALFDGALVLLLQWLIRKFKFGYSVPVTFVVGALVVGAGLVGFTLDRGTHVNDRLFEGREHLFHQELRGSGICRCTVLSIDGNKLLVEDTRDATTTLTIVLPAHDAHATTTGLRVGDVVFIAGHEEDGVIKAFGLRKSTH